MVRLDVQQPQTNGRGTTTTTTTAAAAAGPGSDAAPSAAVAMTSRVRSDPVGNSSSRQAMRHLKRTGSYGDHRPGAIRVRGPDPNAALEEEEEEYEIEDVERQQGAGIVGIVETVPAGNARQQLRQSSSSNINNTNSNETSAPVLSAYKVDGLEEERMRQLEQRFEELKNTVVVASDQHSTTTTTTPSPYPQAAMAQAAPFATTTAPGNYTPHQHQHHGNSSNNHDHHHNNNHRDEHSKTPFYLLLGICACFCCLVLVGGVIVAAIVFWGDDPSSSSSGNSLGEGGVPPPTPTEPVPSSPTAGGNGPQPTLRPTGAQRTTCFFEDVPCATECVTVQLDLWTDHLPTENNFTMINVESGAVAWSQSTFLPRSSYTFEETVCPANCYLFQLHDSYGDGLNSGLFFDAGYELLYDGQMISKGAEIGFLYETFLGDSCPTNRPTASPTPKPTQQAPTAVRY